MKFICQRCGKRFFVEAATVNFRKATGKTLPMYCSRKCKDNTATVTCSCGTRFEASQTQIKNGRKSCSMKCMAEHRKTGREFSCAECGSPVYVSGHRIKRHSTYFCSNDCRLKYQYGNVATPWVGFVENTTEYRRLVDRLRKSPEYAIWKQAVLKKGKCNCGSTKGLQAHHVVPLVKIVGQFEFDESRIRASKIFNDQRNGECLCSGCHAHKHGMSGPLQAKA